MSENTKTKNPQKKEKISRVPLKQSEYYNCLADYNKISIALCTLTHD